MSLGVVEQAARLERGDVAFVVQIDGDAAIHQGCKEALSPTDTQEMIDRLGWSGDSGINVRV